MVGGARPVERFMKHYFLVAKEVGELTMVISAALEMKQLKAQPVAESSALRQTWRDRALLRRRTDFRIDHGRIRDGDAEAMTDAAYAAWRADRNAGVVSVLIAGTRDDVSTPHQRRRAVIASRATHV